MKANELAAIKEDQQRRNPEGYLTTEARLLAEVERLRGIVEKVAANDHHKKFSVDNCQACGVGWDKHLPDCPYRLAVEWVEENK